MPTKCDLCGKFASEIREFWVTPGVYDGPDGDACRRCRPDLWDDTKTAGRGVTRLGPDPRSRPR